MITREALVDLLTPLVQREHRLALLKVAPSSPTFRAEDEVVGKGYSSGGKALTGARLVEDAAGVAVAWDSPVVWPASTIRARWAVIYDAASKLVRLRLDLGEVVASSNGAFRVDLEPEMIRFAVEG